MVYMILIYFFQNKENTIIIYMIESGHCIEPSRFFFGWVLERFCDHSCGEISSFQNSCTKIWCGKNFRFDCKAAKKDNHDFEKKARRGSLSFIRKTRSKNISLLLKKKLKILIPILKITLRTTQSNKFFHPVRKIKKKSQKTLG